MPKRGTGIAASGQLSVQSGVLIFPSQPLVVVGWLRCQRKLHAATDVADVAVPGFLWWLWPSWNMIKCSHTWHSLPGALQTLIKLLSTPWQVSVLKSSCWGEIQGPEGLKSSKGEPTASKTPHFLHPVLQSLHCILPIPKPAVPGLGLPNHGNIPGGMPVLAGRKQLRVKFPPYKMKHWELGAGKSEI